MNALFRARVDKRLLEQAQTVCAEMGLDTQEAVRLFLAALVRRRELPFKASAETPEDELLQPQARRAELLESFYELHSLTPPSARDRTVAPGSVLFVPTAKPKRRRSSPNLKGPASLALRASRCTQRDRTGRA